MKFAVFAMLLAIAGAYAMPEPDVAQARIVDIVIREAVQNAINRIRNAGWDPKVVEEQNFHYTFPGLFDLRGFIDDLVFTGASDIRIENLYYNILFGRLAFNVRVPELKVTVGNSGIQGTFLGSEIEGILSGSVVVKDTRLEGEALLLLSANWVQIYNINVDWSFGDVESNLIVHGSEDFTDISNEVLSVRIPEFLRGYRNEINVLLGQLIREIVSRWNDNRPRFQDLE